MNEDLRGARDYMSQHSLEFCRMAFRIRTKQIVCRVNMPKLYNNVLWCHVCASSPVMVPGGDPAPQESQEHMEQCSAYVHLREGKDVEFNFTDKVKYFMEVTKERSKTK